MTQREEVSRAILDLPNANILAELPTGFGKSKIAIDLINKYCNKSSRILIVVPRLVLIENWKQEMKKWGCKIPVEFVTYVSFPKKLLLSRKDWDYVVFDECFQGDTEILTEEGYKKLKDLGTSDKVAQFTNEGNIEFVTPIRLIKRPHNGKICKVHLGRGRYVYMTPNHNQVYRTNTKDWKVKEVKDLNFNYFTEIPVSGKGTGNGATLSTLERLLIAIQADGALQRHQKNESVYSIQVTKDRKKNRLKQLLKDYGLYTPIKGRPEVDRYMIKVPKGDAKLFSTNFSINMSYERAKSFIEEVIEWDGSHLKGTTKYYSSKVKENADFVAAVAVQAGYKVLQSIEEDNRKDSYSTIHRVYMRPDTESVNCRVMSKEYLDYNDYVYCVEVPSHKIVVRSQGYTFISGNCHHLSERCRDAIAEATESGIKINRALLLSATINRELRRELPYVFKDLYTYKVSMKKAIEGDTLPDPEIILIPLKLDNVKVDHKIIRNRSAKKGEITIDFKDRFKYKGIKDKKIIIKCTQQQYYDDMESLITWYKSKSFIEAMKNLWLRSCGDRNKWLSNQKTQFVYDLLQCLKNERTLTFCNSIEHTTVLGSYAINSSNKDSDSILSKFNSNEIKHITACNMLDEGVNLRDCQYGIFAMLNSSERMIIQKLGRLLRHQEPVVIIPYYVGTRDEELVKKMTENYKTTIINDLNSFKQWKQQKKK